MEGAAYWLVPHGLFSLFSYGPQPGMVPPTVTEPLILIISQENAPQANLEGAFSLSRFPFLKRLELCQVDVKLASIKILCNNKNNSITSHRTGWWCWPASETLGMVPGSSAITDFSKMPCEIFAKFIHGKLGAVPGPPFSESMTVFSNMNTTPTLTPITHCPDILVLLEFIVKVKRKKKGGQRKKTLKFNNHFGLYL